MSDYISRNAAVYLLKTAYFNKDIQSAANDPCIVDAMTDWAIRQIKALPAKDVPHWISVEERLPDEEDYKPCHENYDGAVLWCSDAGVIGIGWYYECTGNWADIKDNCVPGKVTHWMRLPDTPIVSMYY